MLARVQSYLLQGIDALPCEVEVDLDIEGSREAKPLIVGLPDTAVKESTERVQSALLNSGYLFPHGRLLINLAPADLRKEGPLYDLPIAVGILITQGVIASDARRGSVRAGRAPRKPVGARSDSLTDLLAPEGLEAKVAVAPPAPDGPGSEPLDPRRYLFAGELALDGRLRPVRGIIAMAALAKARGYAGVIVPAENAAEAAVVAGVEAIGVSTLSEVVGLLNGAIEPRPHPPADVESMLHAAGAPVDFADVRGQEAVKRAIVVAAAGGHNLMKLGPSDRYRRSHRQRVLGHNVVVLCPSDAHRVVHRVYSALSGSQWPGECTCTA